MKKGDHLFPSRACLKKLISKPKGVRAEATVLEACSLKGKRFPGGRHRRKADSQTVIGAFDRRRVTKWLIGKGQPGNKAFPIFVAVQCGPVSETGTLRFQIQAGADSRTAATVEGLGLMGGSRLG